jgi:outer membrane lipoprotein-sorting protein
VSSLRERRTFQQNTKSFINPTVTHDVNQAKLLNLVENNPHIGSREISSQTGISKSSVLRIKKKKNTNITRTTWNFTKSCMVKIWQIE